MLKENQEGFPKLCLGGREGDRDRLGGSTLMSLSLEKSQRKRRVLVFQCVCEPKRFLLFRSVWRESLTF